MKSALKTVSAFMLFGALITLLMALPILFIVNYWLGLAGCAVFVAIAIFDFYPRKDKQV